jgi:hypothetical protein
MGPSTSKFALQKVQRLESGSKTGSRIDIWDHVISTALQIIRQ